MSGVSISFPHLFLRPLNKVHRSSAIGHALIHPILIHRILLFLGLDDFPFGEPVHVVAPIGATDNALKCILVICLCGRYLLITMLNLYN